jgi:hypothetical protein
MNANELADFIKDISEYAEFNGRHYCQQCFKEAQDMLRQQQAEIEALKLQLHTTLTNRNLEKPSVDEFMEKYCTCYKLGYSPLNDYASVKAK